MLASMKAIKMMGVGDRVGKVVEKLRLLEFDVSKQYCQLILGSFVICMCIYVGTARLIPINIM